MENQKWGSLGWAAEKPPCTFEAYEG